MNCAHLERNFKQDKNPEADIQTSQNFKQDKK